MTRDEKLTAFCQALIRIPSFSGQEKEVASLIEKAFPELSSWTSWMR